MSTETHTYRVTLRGFWQPADDAERARLRAGLAAAEGLDAMRFTEDGSLSYDRTLKAFSFRVEVRSEEGDGVEMAIALAEEIFEELLDDRGLHCGPLRASVTDMDTVKIKRKRA